MLAAVALVLDKPRYWIKMQRTKYICDGNPGGMVADPHHSGQLVWKLFSANPQMEGFFYMANLYIKEKIANGTKPDRAAEIANMKPYRRNVHTNAA